MTQKQLFKAINETAFNAGIKHWIEIDNIVFASMAIEQLSALLWKIEFKDDENTRLIREQALNLVHRGNMIFEDGCGIKIVS